MSSDLNKGDPWFETITTNLKENELGLVFITSQNMDSSWLNFEAGALLNKFDRSGVRPVLVDLKKGDYKGPMSSLQLTELEDKDDVLLLMKSINDRCTTPLQPKILEKAFYSAWNELDESVRETVTREETPKGKTTSRTQGDKIDEILNLVRGVASEEKYRPRPRKTTTAKLIERRGAESIEREDIERREHQMRLDAFEHEHGGLVANKPDGTIADVKDFRKKGGQLQIVVELKNGEREIWTEGEFNITPF